MRNIPKYVYFIDILKKITTLDFNNSFIIPNLEYMLTNHIMYIKYRQKKSLICLKASTTVFKNTDISYMILTNLNFKNFFCWQSVEKICEISDFFCLYFIYMMPGWKNKSTKCFIWLFSTYQQDQWLNNKDIAIPSWVVLGLWEISQNMSTS
jgi:hypothetical protein